MVEENKHRPVSLNEYHPQDLRDVVLIVGKNIPIPNREEIQPGRLVTWNTVEDMNTERTLIISNLIHTEFPNTYCQIQLSLSEKGSIIFMARGGSGKEHMSQELVNQIFQDRMLPQIWEEIEREDNQHSE